MIKRCMCFSTHFSNILVGGLEKIMSFYACMHALRINISGRDMCDCEWEWMNQMNTKLNQEI